MCVGSPCRTSFTKTSGKPDVSFCSIFCFIVYRFFRCFSGEFKNTGFF
jgi:hypothetical protein